MTRSFVFAVMLSGIAVCFAMTPLEASAQGASAQGGHPSSEYYRGGGRGGRRGGYSYNYEDSINTYGDSRGRTGSADSFRDFQLERQTEAGPFDHGFFFDSSLGPHGGDSPYMN